MLYVVESHELEEAATSKVRVGFDPEAHASKLMNHGLWKTNHYDYGLRSAQKRKDKGTFDAEKNKKMGFNLSKLGDSRLGTKLNAAEHRAVGEHIAKHIESDIGYKGTVKEEVEQLDEISAELATRFQKGRARQAIDAELKGDRKTAETRLGAALYAKQYADKKKQKELQNEEVELGQLEEGFFTKARQFIYKTSDEVKADKEHENIKSSIPEVKGLIDHAKQMSKYYKANVRNRLAPHINGATQSVANHEKEPNNVEHTKKISDHLQRIDAIVKWSKNDATKKLKPENVKEAADEENFHVDDTFSRRQSPSEKAAAERLKKGHAHVAKLKQVTRVNKGTYGTAVIDHEDEHHAGAATDQHPTFAGADNAMKAFGLTVRTSTAKAKKVSQGVTTKQGKSSDARKELSKMLKGKSPAEAAKIRAQYRASMKEEVELDEMIIESADQDTFVLDLIKEGQKFNYILSFNDEIIKEGIGITEQGIINETTRYLENMIIQEENKEEQISRVKEIIKKYV